MYFAREEKSANYHKGGKYTVMKTLYLFLLCEIPKNKTCTVANKLFTWYTPHDPSIAL